MTSGSRWLVSSSRLQVVTETGLDVVKTMNRLIVVLQHSRQAMVATQGGLLLGGALWAQSLDFQGENLRSDLHWLYLYLAMADFYSSPC